MSTAIAQPAAAVAHLQGIQQRLRMMHERCDQTAQSLLEAKGTRPFTELQGKEASPLWRISRVFFDQYHLDCQAIYAVCTAMSPLLPQDANPLPALQSHVDHDSAHLGMFRADINGLVRSSLTTEQTTFLEQLFQNPSSYLHFMLYPYDLMYNLLCQHLCLPTEQRPLDFHAMVRNCWLSLAMRSNSNIRFEPYTAQYAAESQFCGVLHAIQDGVSLISVEAYVYSILYNLLKNAFKAFVLEASHPEQDFKVVVAVRQFVFPHPLPTPVVSLEVIDNGPGFNTTEILRNFARLYETNPETAKGTLPQRELLAIEALTRDPYALDVSLSSFCEMMFINRLGGAQSTKSLSSGLGLWGMQMLEHQLGARHLIGINQPQLPPFPRGARFMLVMPTNPHGLKPALQLLTADSRQGHGDPNLWFRGEPQILAAQ